jgi:hypothetical protein
LDPHDDIAWNRKAKLKKQKKNAQLGLGEGIREISWIWRVSGSVRKSG